MRGGGARAGEDSFDGFDGFDAVASGPAAGGGNPFGAPLPPASGVAGQAPMGTRMGGGVAPISPSSGGSANADPFATLANLSIK